ncbi:MAG: heavy metal sensor histidine kinase, partial [Bryobacteraceae bacterium]
SWKSSRPRSLALQLSVWYAASAFLLLAAGTGFLYWELVQSSNTEDDQYLSENVNTLRKLLNERDFRTLKWEVEGESSVRPAVEVLSRVFSGDGRILVESTGMSGQLPPETFPRSGRIEYRTVRNRPSHKRIFRVLSVQLPDYRLQVGVEVTFEKNMLAEYRERLWAVLGVGLLFSAIAGYLIARRGIRPVEEIAATVRRIRSSTLNQRLETTGLASELSVLASTFNETLDGLEDAFARLARFSSDIAHELRTPINNMRGEVEVALGKTRSPEEYREVLESSLEECLRLSRMIDSLLFLARAEHPETQIHRESIDIAGELSAVREFYEAAASEAGVSLDLAISPALRAALDRSLFQRAVGNLIENSLAHSNSGGQIRLKAIRRDGTLLVSVADTGSGIPAEHLPRVFDRFHRVDTARSSNVGGTGLVLAIVKSIAALHGGDARIESTPGQGTCVTLCFPAGEMTKS